MGAGKVVVLILGIIGCIIGLGLLGFSGLAFTAIPTVGYDPSYANYANMFYLIIALIGLGFICAFFAAIAYYKRK